jgi:hypothetical protein
MKPRPIHPWAPGSVRPVRVRPGPRDASHGRVDQPKALRELAEERGGRWYRDACADDHIPGRWGELFRLGVGRLGVQIGGPRANNTMTDVPEGSNTRINAVARRTGWPVAQRGDGEAVFAVPDEALRDALRMVRAYRRPRGHVPSLEVIAQGRENLRKAREDRQSG